MKRTTTIPLVAALLVAVAAQAQAQSGSDAGRASGEATARSAADPARAETEARAAAEVEAEARLAAIRERGRKVADKAREEAERKLATEAERVNDEARVAGEMRVASRLAGEFGTTAEAMMEDRIRYEAGWGELMIAHTLLASSDMDVTLEQLFQLHAEGEGWGRIAAGMGFKLGDVVSAVKAEGRVAQGLARADGKVAAVRGHGAKAGAGVRAGSSAGVKAGGVSAGASAGVKVSAPKIKTGN